MKQSAGYDLKNLRAELYSAAEHFELSYTNDNHKQTVVDTLKDFAVRALVNTVDHLGSVSYMVNGLLNEKVEEVSETEFRLGCMEQRVRMCQEYMEGLREQSITITAPKYHKRYMLKGNLSNSGGGAKVAKPYKNLTESLTIMTGKLFMPVYNFSFICIQELLWNSWNNT
ncbi:protein ABIL2-like [Amborella trichopoda]|uniref:protein ABIL2-like n=1 Tax=Amborella trichopoda TaxID=13333 RepID=UPI0009BFA642|nr:protein ABIL2-like [Amborella trichopoda]|eukprot:XP_020529455.1 protein ABIL2-like [Amborella trichopoda]